MRRAVWPHGSEAEHAEEIAKFFAGRAREPLAVLLATDAAGQALGFVELSIRSHAEGCESDQVAYLEGWYVVREARGRGVGRALESAADDWAPSQGCGKFGLRHRARQQRQRGRSQVARVHRGWCCALFPEAAVAPISYRPQGNRSPSNAKSVRGATTRLRIVSP